jgi:hypothetical protein
MAKAALSPSALLSLFHFRSRSANIGQADIQRVLPMSQLDAQSGQYWKTRTVNEAQLQGYTVLRLTCACGRTTDYPLVLLLQRKNVTRYTFLGNIAFRCKQCGNREPQISVRLRP